MIPGIDVSVQKDTRPRGHPAEELIPTVCREMNADHAHVPTVAWPYFAPFVQIFDKESDRPVVNLPSMVQN